MGAVKINGTTSGSVSLEAPASGSDVTLTLPGSTMDLATELASKLPIAGGKILQIVRATDGTDRTSTSGTYADVTGMSVSITPQKSDSAIIIASMCRVLVNSTSAGGYGAVQITDASNNAISGGQECAFGSNGPTNFRTLLNIWAYATPATTSSVTYKLLFKLSQGTSLVIENAGTTGQMYAIEVSA